MQTCPNCGTPWLDSYAPNRCGGCGHNPAGIPVETPEEAEVLDIIESHQPDPSAGEATFFGAPIPIPATWPPIGEATDGN